MHIGSRSRRRWCGARTEFATPVPRAPRHTERAAGPLSPAVRAARGDGAARHGGSCALARGRPQRITGKGERRRGDGQDHRRRPSPPGAPRCRPWLPRWARCASSAFRVAGVWGHRAQPTPPDRDSHRQAARRRGGHRRRGSRARGCLRFLGSGMQPNPATAEPTPPATEVTLTALARGKAPWRHLRERDEETSDGTPIAKIHCVRLALNQTHAAPAERDEDAYRALAPDVIPRLRRARRHCPSCTTSLHLANP